MDGHHVAFSSIRSDTSDVMYATKYDCLEKGVIERDGGGWCYGGM